MGETWGKGIVRWKGQVYANVLKKQLEVSFWSLVQWLSPLLNTLSRCNSSGCDIQPMKKIKVLQPDLCPNSHSSVKSEQRDVIHIFLNSVWFRFLQLNSLKPLATYLLPVYLSGMWWVFQFFNMLCEIGTRDCKRHFISGSSLFECQNSCGLKLRTIQRHNPTLLVLDELSLPPIILLTNY